MLNPVSVCDLVLLIGLDKGGYPVNIFQTTELPYKLWEKIGIDITGPFQGGQVCLVLVDYFSRYP